MSFLFRQPAFALLTAAALSGALAAGACAPIKTMEGYQAIEHQPKDVKVGVDTKSTVLEALGSPSAVSTFDPNLWYYMTQATDQLAFHSVRVMKRDVIAINFDKDKETVTAVNTFTLKDGKVFAFNGRETPTRGRELSILEQLLGNVGAQGMLPQQEPTPGQRPGNGP